MKPRSAEPEEVEIATLDLDGTIVGVNAPWTSFCALNGGDPDSCGPGASYLEACEAGDDPTSHQVAAALRAVLSGAQLTAVTFTIPCDSPEGDRWYDLCVVPRFGASTETVGATVLLWRVARPPAGLVSARPSAMVVEPHEDWELIEAFPDGTVLVDSSGVITHANRQLEELTGYDRSLLLGQPIEMLVPGDRSTPHTTWSQGYRDAPRVRAMGPGVALHLVRADGRLVPVEISLAPVTVTGEPMTMASVRDVSTQRADDLARGRLELLEDRQRIARDLHDTVIQALIGIGLQLGPGHDDSLVEQLDAAILRLRLVVFDNRERLIDERITETVRRAAFARGRQPSDAGAARGTVECRTPRESIRHDRHPHRRQRSRRAGGRGRRRRSARRRARGWDHQLPGEIGHARRHLSASPRRNRWDGPPLDCGSQPAHALMPGQPARCDGTFASGAMARSRSGLAREHPWDFAWMTPTAGSAPPKSPSVSA